MGLLDNLRNFADSTRDQLNAVKNTVIPMEIQNLKKSHDQLAADISAIESNGIIANSPQALTAITHLRTFLMTHYGHLMRGGDPEPVVGGKAHPLYLEVKNGFADLDSRLSALEQKYQNCVFGYQAADGNIYKPSLDWTQEQWLEIKNSSKDQVARCWLNSDKNQYC